MILDIHTHKVDSTCRQAIISVEPAKFCPIEGQLYSVGIHPWNTVDVSDAIELLEKAVSNDVVVAIGETGVDTLRGASKERQIELFKLHISLSERYQKPVIIHAVHSYNEVMMLRKELKANMPWIIHGFRGNAEVARQLLTAGIKLSIGEHFNSAAMACIPINEIFVETDDSTLSIDAIYSRISQARGEEKAGFKNSVIGNISKCFILPS